MRYTFTGESKVIDIIDSTILEDIKARLRSRDRRVILELANEEDKSREGSGIDGETDSENKDN